MERSEQQYALANLFPQRIAGWVSIKGFLFTRDFILVPKMLQAEEMFEKDSECFVLEGTFKSTSSQPLL